MSWAKRASPTKPHNQGCTMAFGRPTKDRGVCARCDELAAGAAPVKGWGQQKREAEARLSLAIKQHDCVKSNCGPVCTKFDW